MCNGRCGGVWVGRCEDLEEAGLEALLFKQAAPNEHYAAPDWMMWTPGGYAEICIGRATPACPRRPPAA